MTEAKREIRKLGRARHDDFARIARPDALASGEHE